MKLRNVSKLRSRHVGGNRLFDVKASNLQGCVGISAMTAPSIHEFCSGTHAQYQG